MYETLIAPNVKAQFAGHETFPLRLLWLKKAFEAVKDGADRGVFYDQDAIARFGVGRNMVMAIRHWSIAAGMITEDNGFYTPTKLGKLLLDNEHGVDPYLEDPASAWIVHFLLASTPEMSTTFYFSFNGLIQSSFDRASLVSSLFDLSDGRKSWRVSANTLKRDVEVFVRSYIARGHGEDSAEPLLAELGLLREGSSPGQFEFVRSLHPTLPDGIFAWALRHFWKQQFSEAPTLSMEQICYGPGSPGRVFKLDEESVHSRLSNIAVTTAQALSWTDTAGLRQVMFHREPDDEVLLRASFQPRLREAA